MKKTLLSLVALAVTQFSGAQILEDHCWDSFSSLGFHSLAVKSDHTLWAWGHNAYGQLGNGETTNSSIPVQVSSEGQWAVVAGGSDHSVALKADHTLWTWGRNNNGQLGDNTNTDNGVPTQIGTANDWEQIAAGAFHTLAIKANGTLWGWGNNSYQQLTGTGARLVPTQIGSATDWVEVACGSYFTIARKSNGTLWAWGKNGDGELGIGSSGGSTIGVPTQIGTDTNWNHVDAGFAFAVASKNTEGANLWAWGSNTNGQLGDNTTVNKNSPIPVGGDVHYDSFSVGLLHVIAVKSDNTLWSWGRNMFGELGIGSTTDSYTPVQVGTNDQWTHVSCGASHTFAQTANGDSFLWGRNHYGQVGNTTVIDQTTPFFLSTCSTITGLNENTLSQITLYPNPTSSMLTLANTEMLNIENLSVTDMTGKLVLSQKGNSPEINVEVLPAGIYFLNVSSKEGVQHLKFVKE
ncbi:T9SS type A sorting domain-containing protein [Flavobacterium suzhouense]|uniref:T9SS type A sorting domain-containing protein n=1 Tax=Flavobacterium suzhouense TaxID=1529638 RepID=A0ABW5NQQ2_9FLAO